jgi:hypothetical protein
MMAEQGGKVDYTGIVINAGFVKPHKTDLTIRHDNYLIVTHPPEFSGDSSNQQVFESLAPLESQMFEPDLRELTVALEEISTKSSFMKKLRQCLDFVQTHPYMQSIVGVKWIDQETFIVSSKILANILKIKVNTLNYNFRAHGFDISKKFPGNFAQYLTKTCDLRSWYPRRHILGLFTTTSAEEDPQITTFFSLMKIAALKKRRQADFERASHDQEHNDEEQSHIEPPFFSRAGSDPENDCWYDFEGSWESEEHWVSFPA